MGASWGLPCASLRGPWTALPAWLRGRKCSVWAAPPSPCTPAFLVAGCRHLWQPHTPPCVSLVTRAFFIHNLLRRQQAYFTRPQRGLWLTLAGPLPLARGQHSPWGQETVLTRALASRAPSCPSPAGLGVALRLPRGHRRGWAALWTRTPHAPHELWQDHPQEALVLPTAPPSHEDRGSQGPSGTWTGQRTCRVTPVVWSHVPPFVPASETLLEGPPGQGGGRAASCPWTPGLTVASCLGNQRLGTQHKPFRPDHIGEPARRH